MIQTSTGYFTNLDGSRTPLYNVVNAVSAQAQPVTYNDIVQLDGLNIQGIRRKLYLNGNYNGIIRADGKGGDILEFPDGSTWLVVCEAENWAQEDGWCAVLITQQNPSTIISGSSNDYIFVAALGL